MAKGYGVALTSSIGIGLSLRKMTAGLAARSSGSKLLLLNFLVSFAAGGSAGFCNTLAMRYTEIEKGIKAFSDSDLKHELGRSKQCAQNAVYDTATSRVGLNFITLLIPTMMMMGIGASGLRPKNKVGKSIMDVGCVAAGLWVGLPASVALFPNLQKVKGTQCEEQFHKNEFIYYNRGK